MIPLFHFACLSCGLWMCVTAWPGSRCEGSDLFWFLTVQCPAWILAPVSNQVSGIDGKSVFIFLLNVSSNGDGVWASSHVSWRVSRMSSLVMLSLFDFSRSVFNFPMVFWHVPMTLNCLQMILNSSLSYWVPLSLIIPAGYPNWSHTACRC